MKQTGRSARTPPPPVLAASAFLAALALIALAAPLWSGLLGTGPDDAHLSASVNRSGVESEVVSPSGIPIGPAFSAEYPLGADASGRDLSVRLAYGARTSLVTGVGSAALAILLGMVAGITAGLKGRKVDSVIRWLLDLIWSFPVIVLAMALGVVIAGGGVSLGPIVVGPGSPVAPIVIIGTVLCPYVARPLRTRTLTIAGAEFIVAARLAGAGRVRMLLREVIPNLGQTLVELVPVLVAGAVLIDAALNFLGVGSDPQGSNWGAMIREGTALSSSAPHLALVPGITLIITVLSLNAAGSWLARRAGLSFEPPQTGTAARRP